MNKLAIFGCGGHGQVSISIARSIGWSQISLFDDNYHNINNVDGNNLVGDFECLKKDINTYGAVFVAIGNNFKRRIRQHNGEIVGGGQREDDHDTLVKRIEDHGLPLSSFKWYLDLRKYGSVTHSGFGLGLERTVSWICGIDHVRQTIPFPRTMGRLEP